MPYTDNPHSVIEGLTKVKAFYQRGWAQRWERVLTAVAVMPGPEGEALLAKLAREHRDIATEFEWMKNILRRNTASAVLLYVDLFIENVFGHEAQGPNAWHVGRELAQCVAKFPELKAELKKRYETASGNGRAMLEHLFGEIGDDEDLVAMVRKYAANKQRYDQRMDRAVYAVTVEEIPVSEGSNSYNIHPASVGAARKALFGMLDAKSDEAALAKQCLSVIDHLRDEHGIAANDPRHPDVMSGKPWPEECRIALVTVYAIRLDVAASPGSRFLATANLKQEIRYCKAPDAVRLAYARVGNGPPILRSAHWLGHLEYDWELPIFQRFLLELAKEHTLIRYDARGNGLSDWDVHGLSLDAWVSDMETVADVAGLGRFPLLGLSQGCPVAVAYAVRHPERVSHLILYGGFALGLISGRT